MAIQDKKQIVISQFDNLETWEDKYRQIIHFGKKLPLMDEKLKTDDTLVKGCMSKVWLYHRYEDGLIHFEADSEAAITKGIIALLVAVYSANTPEDILALKPEFLGEIGITDHLSMNRRNGLVNMCKLITVYALAHIKRG